MRRTDRDGRNEDRGIGADKAQLEESQRDVDQKVEHMPRHWQSKGTRGEEPNQAPLEADKREIARGNQYGAAGEAASKQIHDDLTEHGETAAPQHRDNEQMRKRAGEAAEDTPTPEPGDVAVDKTREGKATRHD